ncbi:MAG: glycosyltransferase family 1 protein, partial [Pseudomonadota bacterium]
MTGPGRIHWVSPLPPAPTDIAEYTRRLIPHLAARAELVLWTDAEAWEPGLEALAPPGRVRVRRFDPKAPLPFAADALGGHAGPAAVFFHMGNSWVFHGGILALAARQPGVLVLHDLALREALRDLVLNGRWPERRLREAARRWYGHEAQADIDALLAGRATGAADLARAPLWEAALGRATGVLTHTGPAADAVAARRAVPVYRLPLPFPAGDGAPNPERDGDRDGDGDGSGGGPLRLVQFGHVGPNRRLEQVFEAIARVKGRVAVEIDVFGKLWDEAHLARAAAKLGIAEHVRFRGFAPEVELDAALARAHCVTKLRPPSMGEASGSQLRSGRAAA